MLLVTYCIIFQALEAVESGLKDDLVTAGRRLALYQRAEKICTAPKSKYKDRIKKLTDESVKPTPEVPSCVLHA